VLSATWLHTHLCKYTSAFLARDRLWIQLKNSFEIPRFPTSSIRTLAKCTLSASLSPPKL